LRAIAMVAEDHLNHGSNRLPLSGLRRRWAGMIRARAAAVKNTSTVTVRDWPIRQVPKQYGRRHRWPFFFTYLRLLVPESECFARSG